MHLTLPKIRDVVNKTRFRTQQKPFMKTNIFSCCYVSISRYYQRGGTFDDPFCCYWYFCCCCDHFCFCYRVWCSAVCTWMVCTSDDTLSTNAQWGWPTLSNLLHPSENINPISLTLNGLIKKVLFFASVNLADCVTRISAIMASQTAGGGED